MIKLLECGECVWSCESCGVVAVDEDVADDLELTGVVELFLSKVCS